jgi:hypothetical protein
MAQEQIKFDPVFIDTLSGERVRVEKLNWKQEREVVAVIGKMVEQLPELQNVDFKKLKISDALAAMPVLLQKVPTLVTDMVSIILNREAKWIDENLNFDIITEVVSPFLESFSKILKRYKKAKKEMPLKTKKSLPSKNT